uniref:XRCC2 n=1 Tax=Arundo donax TaxID=35708 RepID=A0A0A9HFQ7_ARUDO
MENLKRMAPRTNFIALLKTHCLLIACSVSSMSVVTTVPNLLLL